ncbi:hypothetical protein N8156_05955 [Rhodospirillaceae bacterium]|nr:hypothetical protein [Rhodospirillaceae bacterium]
MSHRLLSEAVKAWTNIREQRPLKSLSTNPIIVGTLEGLSNAQPNLEIATIGLDELNKRRKPNAKNGIKAIDPKLSEIGHSTIPWLFKVSYNLLHLQKEHPPKEDLKNNLICYFERWLHGTKRSLWTLYRGNVQDSRRQIRGA